jgi:hypothetical protein
MMAVMSNALETTDIIETNGSDLESMTYSSVPHRVRLGTYRSLFRQDELQNMTTQ